MNLLDVAAMLVCTWFSIRWACDARRFRRSNRNPEGMLLALCAVNAGAVAVASLFVRLPFNTLEGIAVRGPGVVMFVLCLALAKYLHAKARGQLPVLAEEYLNVD